MATQQVRPDLDRHERQRVQRRQVSRTLKFGSLGIAAIAGALAVLILIVAVGSEVQRGQPTATEPAVTVDTTGPSGGPERPNGSRPNGSDPAAPKHGKLIMSAPSGYVVYVRTDHRITGLAHVPFRLGHGVLDLLRNAEPTGRGWALTTEDARALVKILNDSGLGRTSTGDTFLGRLAYTGSVIDGIDINRHIVHARIEIRAILPDVLQGYVVFVRTDHRTLGLAHVPRPLAQDDHRAREFRLGDGVLDLLRSAEPTGRGWALTTEDARALVKILNDSGLRRTSTGDTFLEKIAYTGHVIDGIDINRHGVDLRIEFRPILRD